MHSNQKGFSVVGILVVIVVIGLVGTVGWLVYDRQKSKTSETQNTQTSTQQKETSKQETKVADPYEGWKSYCSDTGACFKYPADWNSVTTGPAGPEPGNFKNPQQTLKLVSGKSDSNGTLTDPAQWYTGKLESLSSANDKYKVWGGYLAATGVYVPQYAVVDATIVGNGGFMVGQTKSTTDDTYTTFTTSGGAQHYTLNVFALSNDGFTKAKADAWFSSEDAKTALLIVQSLYFK